jgi:hypothetical protein
MVQFVGLLDADGTVLEINKVRGIRQKLMSIIQQAGKGLRMLLPWPCRDQRDSSRSTP